MSKQWVKIRFLKMTGAGNDFVLIDNLEQEFNLNWFLSAPVLCNRRYGVGADGLLIIEKSSKAAFTMSYFNADGTYGGMCGNGGRCSANYVMEKLGLDEVRFEALGYTYEASRKRDDVKLQMKDINSIQTNIKVRIGEDELLVNFVDSGAPHVVILQDSIPSRIYEKIRNEGIVELGRAMRHHPTFAPDGTNVNFIEPLSKSTISMRTYERGVEDETLACGTGAVASATCFSYLNGASSPISVQTRSNEVLKVHFLRENERFKDVVLEGSAKRLFQGSLYYSPIDNQVTDLVHENGLT